MSFHSRRYVCGTVHHFYDKRIIIRLALCAFPINLDIVQTEDTPHRNPSIFIRTSPYGEKAYMLLWGGILSNSKKCIFHKTAMGPLITFTGYMMYNARVTWFYHVIPYGIISIIREASANAAADDSGCCCCNGNRPAKTHQSFQAAWSWIF